MKRLFIFGDSHSNYYNMEAAKPYLNFLGYTPQNYPEIICDRLNLELKKFPNAASDNLTIFQSICDNIHLVKPNDIVIINWTDSYWTRIVNKSKGKWRSISYETLEKEIDDVSNSALKEVLDNRKHILYKYEILSFIKIINLLLKKNKVIHWSAYVDSLPIEVTQIKQVMDINDEHYVTETINNLAEHFITDIKGDVLHISYYNPTTII
jgi:hypothetical protein